MAELLIDHAPRVRCHECGSDRVFALCHHCQRPMCEQHSPLAFRQEGGLVRTPTVAVEAVRPASMELVGLGLSGVREAVYHCPEHQHVVHKAPVAWVGVGAGIAALGLLLLCVDGTTGVLVCFVGAVLAGSAVLVHRTRAANAVRPALPLVPHLRGINLVERLSGYVRLADGRYTSEVDSLAGQLTVEMSANDGHLALRAYRKKFKLTEAEPVPFSAGYLMLEGEVGLAFRAAQAPMLANGAGLALGGESAVQHELFPVDPDLPHRESTTVIDYAVQVRRSPQSIPLWIVPSLVPGEDQRTLEVDLHADSIDPPAGGGHGTRSGPRLSMFDLIELEVPARWGEVEDCAPDRIEIGRAGERRIVRWKQVKPGRGQQSLTLRLRFQRPITEPVPATGPAGVAGQPGAEESRQKLTLSGRLEATFDGLLSGVTGVGVYLPGGGRGQRPHTSTTTTVAVRFDVGLGSLRYQDDRVIPDDKCAADIADGRLRPAQFLGVVPDHSTVAEVTNAISGEGYYVKSVVEHPPYRDDTRPGVVNRVWDIAGRLYAGIFPIGFTVNLRGQQADVATGFPGRTRAQVTVTGTHARRVQADQPPAGDPGGLEVDPATSAVGDSMDDEMLRKIEDAWVKLHDRVCATLSQRADRTGGTRALPTADEVRFAEHIHHPATPEPGQRPWAPADAAAPVWDAVIDAVEVVAGVPLRRADELRRQLAIADEALLGGRISEQTHRGILTRIEAELRDLEGTS